MRVPSSSPRERLSRCPRYSRIRSEDFDNADLATTTLDQLWLDRCSFFAVNLRHATLVGCSFKLCNLSRADLRGASLRGAHFAGCDLRGADLRDADLTNASFTRVNTGIKGYGHSDLRGALLDGAILTGTTIDALR